MNNSILQVENLVKGYGDVQAVRGVSFSVEEGEVFGLLGPNGAGKTTTVEIMEGLRTPDSGRVSVCGLDPQKSPQELKHEIGAALQSTSLPDKLRVMEALRLFSSFYRRHRSPEELLKRFGLEEKRNSFYSQLSGGQKQRLALAMALVNDPKVLFFDEPTSGLDPQVRREIYDIIEELRREKKTIVMTTHYIEEAERLCDRVAIVDHGQVIALGSPRELKERSGDKTRLEVRLARPETQEVLKHLESVTECRILGDSYILHTGRPPQAIVDHGQVIALGSPRELKERSGDKTRLEVRLARPETQDVLKNLEGVTECRILGESYILHCRRPPQAIVALVKHLESQGNELVSLEIATPSLEDVFIELTGRRLRD